MFEPISNKVNFVELEKEILSFWQDKQIFAKSLEKTKNKKKYVFYDGPPFATGLPHYGHLLASTIKDIIPRYQTMQGRYVPRKWGWDCHGLPVEMEIQNKLNLKSNAEVEAFGVDRFNEECRSIVLRYTEEWKKTIQRLGRWVDFDNGYKTMDKKYMESIWWVFKKLYDKGLIYRGFKVMPYSWQAGTTLSNFEANLNYKDVQDPAVTVKIPSATEENTYFLIWTTTPWTLISNLALCVNNDIEYIKYPIQDEYYITSKNYYLELEHRSDYQAFYAEFLLLFLYKFEEIGTTDTNKLLYGYKLHQYIDNIVSNRKRSTSFIKQGYLEYSENGNGSRLKITEKGKEYLEEYLKKKNKPWENLLLEKYSFDLRYWYIYSTINTKDSLQNENSFIEKLNENNINNIDDFELSNIKSFFLTLVKNIYPEANESVKDEINNADLSLPTIQFIKGSDLAGRMYSPLFPYAQNSKVDTTRCYRILADDYVSETDGTGIVHLAPAYGEDDQRICLANGIKEVFDPVDADGNFVKEIDFIAGENIKAADKKIIAELKDKKLLLKQDTIQHSYPFCWRTESPLIYKAMATWFVDVQKIKDQLVANNQKINWQPEHLKNGRFGKWLADAKDWGISRNRYWGTPIPIWQSEEGDYLCYGDLATLEKDTGKNISDMHKHFIDDLIVEKNGKKYRRIKDVLDCWFESGSMPYGQQHYPFANEEEFKREFPADFIAEGLDQTRGWFYTLLVIGTALFEDAPFKNTIVNGLILAEDGKKMSKKLKNYPDPHDVFNEYGADALRSYLINSNVVKAEDLYFSEKGLKEVLRKIMIPLWNSFSFFITYANLDQYHYRELDYKEIDNSLDLWILSYKESLLANIVEALDNYQLNKAVPLLVTFIEQLTNTYIRRNRRRFWKSENDEDKNKAYFVLYTVLKDLAKIIAPFLPFTAEKIYLTLKFPTDQESVHLENYPVSNPEWINKTLEEEMEVIETILLLGRNIRLQYRLKIRQPLQKITIISEVRDIEQIVTRNKSIIMDELNIKDIFFHLF